jgi:hypothetical protein
LLTIKEELVAPKRTYSLFDGQAPRRSLFIGFPHENAPRRISSIERVQQISDTGCWPHIAALKFGEAKVALVDHIDEFPY